MNSFQVEEHLERRADSAAAAQVLALQHQDRRAHPVARQAHPRAARWHITYDLCIEIEGEGGGWPDSDQNEGGFVELVLTRGRGRVKNPKNLADAICT